MPSHEEYVRSERWKARSFAEHQLRKQGISDCDIDALAKPVRNQRALARMGFDDQIAALAAACLVADRELDQCDAVTDATYWALRLAEYAEDLRLLCRFGLPAGDWMIASGKPAPAIDRNVSHSQRAKRQLEQINQQNAISDDAARTAYLSARAQFPGRQKGVAIEASGVGRKRLTALFNGNIP